MMQDDDLLLYRDAATRDAALAQMRALGVDRVRVTVLWSVAAQGVRSTPARRRRFAAADPATYPSENWDRYDNLVRSARAHGIGVYFSVTGPGPAFTHGVAPRGERRSAATWMPDARAFGRFVAALGTRYSGRYRDEDEGRAVLPRVSFWGLWNEPNQGGWLTPQHARVGGATIPMSPIVYRRLFLYGRRALQSTGHGRDVILLGETAPIGSAQRSARAPMRPARFLRELLCVAPNGRRYTGAAAKVRDCAIFRRLGPLRASGYGHHPYTKDLAPTQRDASPDSLTTANLSALPRLLDRLATTTHDVPARLPIYLTEFGYETDPPDPFSGQTLGDQAAYVAQGDFLAWREARVASQTQFLLRDVPPLTRYPKGTKRYWFTYQSGLFFADGRPKPSATAYAFPLVARPGGGSVWGHLRPRPGDPVTLELSRDGGTAYAPVGPPVATDGRGFFTATLPAGASGLLRARWTGAQPPFAMTSLPVRVG